MIPTSQDAPQFQSRHQHQRLMPSRVSPLRAQWTCSACSSPSPWTPSPPFFSGATPTPCTARPTHTPKRTMALTTTCYNSYSETCIWLGTPPALEGRVYSKCNFLPDSERGKAPKTSKPARVPTLSQLSTRKSCYSLTIHRTFKSKIMYRC